MRVTHSRSKLRGPKPYPAFRLTAEFVESIRASGHAMNALATMADLTAPRFSTLLYADRFSGTPLLVRRLTVLAGVLQFPPARVFEATR